MVTILTEVIKKLISDGADPNDLQAEFEEAVQSTLEWGLWGDGRWRQEYVCSRCGSPYAGICADKDVEVKITDVRNPAFHKNQEGVTRIPLKQWIARTKGLAEKG